MSYNDSTSPSAAPTRETCPDCGGPVSEWDVERVCDDCGLIIEDAPIDHGPEWRSFDAGVRRRTGPPRSQARHDNGLGSEIGYASTPKVTSAAEERQRQAHSWAKASSTREETEMHAQQEIRRLCDQLELSTALVEQTGALWKSVQSEDIHVGRAYEAVAGACVWAVCRISKNHRSIDEVATHVAVPEPQVESVFWAMVEELELPIPIREPAENIPQIVSTLSIGKSVQRRARDIATRAGECQELIGSSPNGIAAAAVWLAVQSEGGDANQNEIAGAADTSRETVRSIANRLQALEIGPQVDE